jgi:hypothetical protein
MTFAVEREKRALHVFENAKAVVCRCESLDVEVAVLLLWNDKGSPLAPVFTVANKRGILSMKNGKHHLVTAPVSHYCDLLEALDYVTSVDGAFQLNSVDAIRRYWV